MPSRPTIQARDSSGRRVSLLNDEPVTHGTFNPIPAANYPSYQPASMVRSNSRDSVPSSMSSPLTPGLTRADSFDSNMAPISPLTPTMNAADYARQHPFPPFYKDHAHYDYVPHEYPPPPMYERPQYMYQEAHVYEDYGCPPLNVFDRGGKRYPCRYRESRHCYKTFTTSGHASRHSKIHTAEKGVMCTYDGCLKKFTRSDNMKQHLETHTREKSRPKTANSTLTRPAGVSKGASISRPVSRSASTTEQPPVDPALLQGSPNQFQGHHHHCLPSAPYGSAPFQKSPPMTSSYRGLDVLAAAADFTTQS